MDIAYIITGVVGIYFIIRSILIFWLWFFHDRHIKNTNDKLLDVPRKINEDFKGRGATRAGIEPFIKAEERRLEIELKKRELKRKIFLDRAHLILLLKIGS